MSCTVWIDPAGTRATITFAETPGNILTASLVAQLRTALTDLSKAPHLRLVTLVGEGPDFSFGASVAEHAPEVIGRVLPDMHALVVDLLQTAAPTAAVVRGRCLGGGFELALACDFIFAERDAMLGLPEIGLGVFPPAGSVLLPRRAGVARATSAILTGQALEATQWESAGVIERTASGAQLSAGVDEWFDRTLARHSAEALRHAVRAVRAPLLDAVSRELPAVERAYLDELMQSHDAREGVDAFLQKRSPKWSDD